MKGLLKISGRILGVCIALFLMLFLFVFVSHQYPWLFGSKPAFRSEIPVAIDLSFSDWSEMKDIQLKTIDSAPSCASILGVFRGARSSSEHKCVNAGSLTFHYRDGQSLQLGILPGHHSSRYEFRYNHVLFSLPRSRFLEALQSAGIDISKVPQI